MLHVQWQEQRIVEERPERIDIYAYYDNGFWSFYSCDQWETLAYPIVSTEALVAKAEALLAVQQPLQPLCAV